MNQIIWKKHFQLKFDIKSGNYLILIKFAPKVESSVLNLNINLKFI